MAESKNIYRWLAKFSLFTPLLERSVKNLKGVAFETQPAANNDGVVLKGFTISLETQSNDDEVILAAQEKANRIFSYLSMVHRRPVEGYLNNMTEDKPEGELKEGIATCNVSAIIHGPLDLDWAGIEDLLETDDVKLLRQLANYHMGLKSVSPVEKLQKFYLVIEDEYRDRMHPFRQKYEHLRIAVSHAYIDKPAAKANFGCDYLNPLDPQQVEQITSALPDIQNEAERIIKNKLSGRTQSA